MRLTGLFISVKKRERKYRYHRCRFIRLPYYSGGAHQHPEHAGPVSAEVTIRYLHDALEVEIKDNGPKVPQTETDRNTKAEANRNAGTRGIARR